MHIVLITPAPPNSLSGNRCTALRWANIFKKLGHSVNVVVEYKGEPADLMLALHAWRSAKSIALFHAMHPNKPLIVALTGTDVYRFIYSDKDVTMRSIELADHLVGLHALIANTVPKEYKNKVEVIYQSAEPINKRNLAKQCFNVCVSGHLRAEKDSLRPALAAKLLPSDSNIQIHHYGKAHTQNWADDAKAEMTINSRFHWHGEVSHDLMNAAFNESHLMVLPSRMEGGATVISEAVMANMPIIASNIEGSVGLLGEDYPGYYPVEDEQALSNLLYRAETDNAFYQSLVSACKARQHLFTQQREFDSWKKLLAKIF